MSHYKVPKQFVALGALPATATGKVQKHLLKALLDPLEGGGQVVQTPQGGAGAAASNSGAPMIRSRL